MVAPVTVELKGDASQFSKTINEAQKQILALDSTSKTFGNDYRKVMAQVNLAQKEFNLATKSAQASAKGMGSAFATFAKVAVPVAAIAGIAKGVTDIALATVRAGEKLDGFRASIAAITDSSAKADEMLDRVRMLVADTGISFDDAASATKRFALALKDTDASTAQVALLVETFTKLGTIAGATTQETANAMTQLTQALAAGKLSGDELNSLLENAPAVARVISEAMGVSIGQLKELGKQGKITSEIVANALLGAAKTVNEQFEAMPFTIAQSFNSITAVIQDALAEFNKLTVSGGAIATALGTVKGVLDGIVEVLQFVNSDLGTAEGKTNDFQTAAEGAKQRFRELVEVVIGLVGNLQQAAAFATALGKVIASASKFDIQGMTDARVEYDRTAKSIGKQTEATKQSFKDWGVAQDKANKALRDTSRAAAGTTVKFIGVGNAAADAGKKAGGAAKKINEMASAYKSLRDSVLTPAEKYADQIAQIDKIVTALGKQADLTIINRAAMKAWKEYISAATKEALDDLSLFSLGIVDATKTLGDAADEAEKLKGQLYVLAGLDIDTTQYDALASSLGEAAPLADRIILQFKELAKASTFDEIAAEVQMIGIALGKTPEDIQKVIEAMGGAQQEAGKFVDTLTSGISGAFDGIIDSFGQAKASFSEMIGDWLKQLAKAVTQILIVEPLIKSLQQAMKGLGGSGGLLGALFGSAQGNAFAGATGLPHGIYDRPTFFPMPGSGPLKRFASGGVLGEAGAEAILPLKRNSAGRLGVESNGGGVIVNVNNNAPVEVSTTSRSSDGKQYLDIMIDQRLATRMSDGSMDRIMGSQYGVRRVPV